LTAVTVYEVRINHVVFSAKLPLGRPLFVHQRMNAAEMRDQTYDMGCDAGNHP